MKRLVIGLVLVAITVGLTGSGAQATFTKKAVFEASITVGTFPTTTSMTLTATAMVGPPTTAIMLAEPVPPLPAHLYHDDYHGGIYHDHHAGPGSASGPGGAYHHDLDHSALYDHHRGFYDY